MKDSTTEMQGAGLLAHGTSPRWEISVDEGSDGHELSLEIEGPQVYLVFRLRDLAVISEAIAFLQQTPDATNGKGDHPQRQRNVMELGLGQFGSVPVSLLWDNEDFPRCFILVGPSTQSALRITFDSSDISMLIEALQQVAEDISGTT